MDSGAVIVEEKTKGALRVAASFIATGLLIQAFSLLWLHPTSFLLFMFGGGGFLAAGILLYLQAIVSHQ